MAPARRLHVLTMIDRLAPSGAEVFAARVASGLDQERFRSTFCVTRASPAESLAELESAGVRVLRLDRRTRVDVWRWWPLVAFLRREGVDVLHSHKFGSNVWAAVIAPLARVPVLVAHEHTWSYEGRPLRRFLDRELIARSARLVLAVSRADRERMIELERIPAERVRLVESGVPAPPPVDSSGVRAELGVSADAPLVGTVCGLRPQKALDVLLRATALLRSELPALRVLIVGDGPERPRLQQLMDELGLRETVILAGRRPPAEVPRLVDALDLAVLSSDFEGTPLAVLEFMAQGKAVVATRVGGVPDLITDGVHGRLVPSRDPAALARAMGELLRDEAMRLELGQRARERQRAEFDFSMTVARLEALYEELAGPGAISS